jgi:hypothetical protein
MFFGSCRIFNFLLTTCFLVGSCAAQQPETTGVSSVPPVAPTISDPQAPPAQPLPPPHAFWDRTNILLFSGVGVFRGLDYASTRNFKARGRGEILIPDDVVNNSAGFAGLEAAGTAASVGLSYWMHRAGHHKLERWISIVHISVTGFGVVHNYSLKTKHPAQ